MSLAQRFLRDNPGGAPRGKAQIAIRDYLVGRDEPVELTDMIRHPSFRGVHLTAVTSAAQALKGRGLLTYDGRTLRWIGGALSASEPAVEPWDEDPKGFKFDSRCGWCEAGEEHTLAQHLSSIADNDYEPEPEPEPAENPAGADDLHARIARALGWPMRDVTSVSLQSLRDLVRPVDPALADEISRKVQSAGHYVHTGVEVSPTERQIIDFMLVDADDVDVGLFSRASTESVATFFEIPPEVAYKRMNALAKRGVFTKQRDEIKGGGKGGKKAFGWQLWEYGWRPGDKERYEQLIAAQPARNPVPDPNDPVDVAPAVPVAKPGPHGELLRYTVFFRDPAKPAFEDPETWSTWAYSIEHAGDLFRAGHDGFQVVRTEQLLEVG